MKFDFLQGKRQQEVSATADGDVRERIRLPLAVKIIYIVSAFCAVLYLFFLISEPFSDFFNRHISSHVRAFLANLSTPIPFSVAEFVIILLPLWIVVLTLAITRRFGDSIKEMISAMLCICSLLGVIFSSFTLGFAPAYRGSTLDKKLGIVRADVSAQELYDTAMILNGLIAESAKQVSFLDDGSSVMPYSHEQMNDKLNAAYMSICEEYDFVSRLDSRIKPVMLSDAMSYTHITGVYTFFTGEANLNMAFPDYTLPFTAAHELAHQRGIARENEANFMAFLACSRSSDPYIRYCAYINLQEYVLSALSTADAKLYTLAYYAMPLEAKLEMAAYADFYEKYRDSAAGEVSGVINDTFLKLHGTQGTKSYGMVVDLAVSYFKSNNK